MYVTIEWFYKTPKGTETVFHSAELPAAQALLLAEDMERTGRVKSLHFIDRQENDWSLKELKAYLKEIETEPHNITVYFDGGFDIATRQSGLGCAIYYEQNGKSYRLRKNAFSSELQSNNEAEYAALYLALTELELLDVHHLPICITGDSQVVINQLNGEWPALERNLASWADKIDAKLEALHIQPDYKLIARQENKEADKLATQALKGIAITGASELLK
ncbi:reverse transcriptase-like protein [Lysinibacillus piscis]|uniref:RNase H type-1 domain-containing protein n=1 Tax=Lysinibacillus piscis TaxID=2518931 RepID=A0ABQ5NNT3_9BACI|nr:reverse transcriptase-like protein [Lysinibacillus sp. KH24]GLC89900.1 hypothetical protein LYSBPC_30270 [Lysinibacillus sp. KH24]